MIAICFGLVILAIIAIGFIVQPTIPLLPEKGGNKMRTFGFICLAIVVIVGLVVLSVVNRSCDTASKMADKTVFNADKHVYSYEQFFAKANQYDQYKAQLVDVEKKITVEQELLKGNARASSTQRLDNLNTEADGVRNMMRRIAADYNAMSSVGYQKIWKDKNLPEKLGE